MPDQTERPIIIKRKKVVAAEGHHGGAWKVAYADFVTAMMAFFLLMWLLGATNENQRKGIADYFNPTITVNKTSGGGSDIFGGDSVFKNENFASNGTGPAAESAIDEDGSGDANGKNGIGASDNSEDLPFGSEQLPSLSAELEDDIELSDFAESLKSRISVRQTDEGLVIEIFDLPHSRLFEPGTAIPTRDLVWIEQELIEVLESSPNDLAIAAHSRTRPLVMRERDTWELTVIRANVFRDLFETNSDLQDRIVRLTGHSDRELVLVNPLSIRNNRIEVILLN